MSYKDTFNKIPFLNRDDPDFIDGVSPSISAENLNSIQDATILALTAADTHAGDLRACEADITALNVHTTGVRCEIANKTVMVSTSAWTENAAEMRQEAVISDALIRSDTDVDITLPDTMKGKASMYSLNPVTGAVILCADVKPTEDFSVQMIVTEVRSNE